MTYIPSADDLEVITREVWTTFLDGDPSGLVQAGSAEAVDVGADAVTGCVHLSGGYVEMHFHFFVASVARDAAAALFSMSPAEVTHVEVVDALGELANMVGGNVKSMLPGPSTLSLPAVVQGQVAVPGAQVVREVALAWRGETLLVSLWQQAARAG